MIHDTLLAMAVEHRTNMLKRFQYAMERTARDPGNPDFIRWLDEARAQYQEADRMVLVLESPAVEMAIFYTEAAMSETGNDV